MSVVSIGKCFGHHIKGPGGKRLVIVCNITKNLPSKPFLFLDLLSKKNVARSFFDGNVASIYLLCANRVENLSKNLLSKHFFV